MSKRSLRSSKNKQHKRTISHLDLYSSLYVVAETMLFGDVLTKRHRRLIYVCIFAHVCTCYVNMTVQNTHRRNISGVQQQYHIYSSWTWHFGRPFGERLGSCCVCLVSGDSRSKLPDEKELNGFNYCYLILIILFDINHLFTDSELVTSIAHHHHHHVAQPALISMTLSRHPSLSSIVPGRSTKLYPVSALSCFI